VMLSELTDYTTVGVHHPFQVCKFSRNIGVLLFRLTLGISELIPYMFCEPSLYPFLGKERAKVDRRESGECVNRSCGTWSIVSP